MKLSRKLLPALAMLVMSAVMLTTASFAWFATNSQVTAQNMTVNIKSDSAYLLIGTENSHTDIQSANTTAATATAVGDTTLSPVAHEDITYATVGTPGNWYWQVADDAASSASTKEKTVLTASLSGYVVQYTYYVTMAKGSPDGTNLKLGSPVTLTPAATGISTNPVSVIIVCGEKLIELNQANSWTDASVLADKVTDEGCVQIDVYVYYNGSNADVYSNNAAHLGGVTIAFNLVVE